MSIWGIVVAAGIGRRFGGTKHLVELDGRPLWRWAVDTLDRSGLDGILVVGDVPGGIPGGRRRQDSVAAGLARVPDSATAILVHDAARPLASPALVARLIEALVRPGVDGVVPGVALRDTIKRVEQGSVSETIDRSSLVAVQTPQAFTADSLRRAHAEVTADVTDDAAMVEAIGGSIAVVEGEQHNIKVTYPTDLAIARVLLDAARQP
jgi:2-C-methyl-D-erythritol 4-phosphate cytidylyltransferase